MTMAKHGCTCVVMSIVQRSDKKVIYRYKLRFRIAIYSLAIYEGLRTQDTRHGVHSSPRLIIELKSTRAQATVSSFTRMRSKRHPRTRHESYLKSGRNY